MRAGLFLFPVSRLTRRRDLPAKPAFEGEVLRVETGEGFFELGEFCLRAMHFEAFDLGDLEGLLNHRADGLDVSEQGGGIDVALAAVDGVPSEAEAVVEASRFFLGLADEAGAEVFEGVKLAALDVEVGDDGAAGVLRGHNGLMLLGLSVQVGFTGIWG